jgi:hypothetical protein
MALIRKFVDAANAMGTGNALLYAASRLLDRMFGSRVRIVKYIFVSQPVGPLAERLPAGSGVFTLAFIGPQSPLFAEIERPSAVIAARFAQGARCLAATSAADHKLAGFLWFVTGAYDEDEVRARFLPEPAGTTAWDFDVTILPRYRMGRLFAYLWRRAAAELAEAGVKHTLSRISAFNAMSMASHRRLQARTVGKALFLCLGRIQVMTSTVGPRWHLSWRDDQRPVMAIAA